MKASEQATELTGHVEQFNFSPKGSYEGLLLRTPEGLVQVNFPPHAADRLTAEAQVGRIFTAIATAQDDHRPSAHPVYNAEDGGRVRVTGKVVRLNYARHGEPNGAVLDSGDFVHLKPHGAKAAGLTVGQELTAEGDAKPSVTGYRVIEASTVNGRRLESPPAKKKAAAKKKAPRKH